MRVAVMILLAVMASVSPARAQEKPADVEAAKQRLAQRQAERIADVIKERDALRKEVAALREENGRLKSALSRITLPQTRPIARAPASSPPPRPVFEVQPDLAQIEADRAKRHGSTTRP